MTLTFQAVAASALIAMIYTSDRKVDDECVAQLLEPDAVAERAHGAPIRYRLTLSNSCDRPLRVEIEFSCPGRTELVTRYMPPSGKVSWTQTQAHDAAPCSFATRRAGW